MAKRKGSNTGSVRSSGRKKNVKGSADADDPETNESQLESQEDSQKEQVSEQGPRYFLMKSEPDTRMVDGKDVRFGFSDLKARPKQTSCWDGVRNYQARNIMTEMRVGDLAFFYHSNCKEPGVVGIIKVVKESYPDHTAWDAKDPHYDPTSPEDKPKWFMVDVQYVRDLKRLVPLAEIKANAALQTMMLVSRSRLSVQRVTPREWDLIVALSDTDAQAES